MNKDIQNRNDIRKVVNHFYQKLLRNEEFERLFIDVIEVDVLTHMDIVIDFWESVLFQAGKYKNDLIDKHLEVNHRYRLKAYHFKDWLEIFYDSVDELFEGETAKKVKDQAFSLAQILRLKIEEIERKRLELNN